MSSPAIEDRGVEQTLDAVESRCGGPRTRMFVLAARVADLHPAASVCAARAAREGGAGRVVVRGGERAVRLGGAGTPVVAEFRAVELGARIQLGS